MYRCVRDKTFTSFNIFKQVERSVENPYPVWWCIFKAMGEAIKHELDDEVM